MVDPLKRITIPEIRQHPWFLTSLPDYLANPPVVDAEPKVESDVLAKILEMGFDKAEVLRAIKAKEQTQETVAYYLVLDNSKRHKKQQQEMQKQIGGSPGSTPPMGAAASTIDPGGLNLGGTGFIASKSPQGASYTGSYAAVGIGMDGSGPLGSAISGSVPPVAPMRWRLGIASRHRPAKDTLDDVYSILQSMDAKWLRKGPYCLECRKVVKQAGQDVSCVFGIRLYKEPVEPQGHRMVLDMRRVQGDTLLFFEVCSKFHRSLERQPDAKLPEKSNSV